MDLLMTTPNRFLLAALGLSLAMGTSALAQEEAAPATDAPAADAAPAQSGQAAQGADDLSLGSEVKAPDGPGTTYTAATFDSWEQRCMRTEDGSDPCQLYQLLKDGQGTSVAEISLFPLPPGQQAVAGATIVAPLETLLTEQMTISVDGATPKRYPFTWCAPLGCIARVGFTQAEIDGFKKGAKATLTIVPVAAPDQKVVLDISLKGFTAGFDAVSKTPAP
jgi:invasion protein IalB